MLIPYLIISEDSRYFLATNTILLISTFSFFPIPIEIFVIVPGTILIMLFFSSLKIIHSRIKGGYN